MSFTLEDIYDIRETDDYPGIRVSLKANYPPISVPLTVDVTTGDIITPKEIEYTFKLLFDDRTLSILAYNLETVLADKIETVLSRSIANTRPRDFYDIHTIFALRGNECDKNILKRALEQTSAKRGSSQVMQTYVEIIKEVQVLGRKADFYQAGSTGYLFCEDEGGNLFLLEGNLDQTAMIPVAESVKEVKD